MGDNNEVVRETTVTERAPSEEVSTPAQDVVDAVHDAQDESAKSVTVEETTVRSEQVESD